VGKQQWERNEKRKNIWVDPINGMTAWRGGTNDTPFLFNGRYGVVTDPNGLLYMRARYYNPYISRFINPDPAGFAGGLNWYSYAGGNPVSWLDPLGLCTSTSLQGLPPWANLPDYGFDARDPFALAAAEQRGTGSWLRSEEHTSELQSP
jgi:RHS repeat-associated protein